MKSTPTFMAVQPATIPPQSSWILCHWVSEIECELPTQWIWCYMCFRFDTIRKLSASKSECGSFWTRHHSNHAITIVCIKRRKYIHIESRVWGRWLFKASDRRRKSEMEQRRHKGNRFIVLSERHRRSCQNIAFKIEC